ncbi:MAG: NifU family protein [Deltaproteobacteria bacterium]|nr:NifU family protein [Deltaproteobacteria bacterium]
MRDGVEAVLQRIRPHLLADGCDVVLMDVTDDGVVRIALAGKTALCPMSHMTLTVGIDAVLRDAVPGVTKVEIVRTP